MKKRTLIALLPLVSLFALGGCSKSISKNEARDIAIKIIDFFNYRGGTQYRKAKIDILDVIGMDNNNKAQYLVDIKEGYYYRHNLETENPEITIAYKENMQYNVYQRLGDKETTIQDCEKSYFKYATIEIDYNFRGYIDMPFIFLSHFFDYEFYPIGDSMGIDDSMLAGLECKYRSSGEGNLIIGVDNSDGQISKDDPIKGLTFYFDEYLPKTISFDYGNGIYGSVEYDFRDFTKIYPSSFID